MNSFYQSVMPGWSYPIGFGKYNKILIKNIKDWKSSNTHVHTLIKALLWHKIYNLSKLDNRDLSFNTGFSKNLIKEVMSSVE